MLSVYVQRGNSITADIIVCLTLVVVFFLYIFFVIRKEQWVRLKTQKSPKRMRIGSDLNVNLAVKQQNIKFIMLYII